MSFPFVKDPVKNPSKVCLCFVRIHSNYEKRALLNMLVKKGYQLMSESMRHDDLIQTIAIPVKGFGLVGYGSIYVMAEQSYHGATIYPNIGTFKKQFLDKLA